uniref:U4/U6.U5 tri-snRNP-associated protein 1 n=1 Tax=Syphacia muris TaxID=451379 RepID=A0A0N5AQA4_9BILA
MGKSTHHRKRKSDKKDSRSRSRSPRSPREKPAVKKSRLRRSRSRSQSASERGNEESLSIEETNKLRASLGLAPLEVTDQSDSKDGDKEVTKNGGKVFVEDGMEFVHKVPEHMGDKKRDEDLKEKLQVMKQKRKIYDKVLKTKGLADSDSEKEEGVAEWVMKNREVEIERKRAEERAKMLDDMDAEFGVDSLIREEKMKKEKLNAKKRAQETGASNLAGMKIGHSKERFLEGQETVLVLEDKDVLADEEEVLINPNLVDNKRYERNVELRKRKSRYEPYAEDFDEFGMPKDHGLLAKYDEEIEGEKKEGFRLDETGGVDLEKERQEMEVKKNLMLANKMLVSLESPKYKLATDFYTQEEMIAFRKPKKKKDSSKIRKRKTKVLKADDLLPNADDDAEKAKIAGKLAKRMFGSDASAKNDNSVPTIKKEIKLEEGELEDPNVDKSNWQEAEMSGIVDINRLNALAEKDSDDDDSDDNLVGGVDLTGVVIDDDAEDELAAVLDRARKIRQVENKKTSDDADAAAKVRQMLSEHSIKQEVMDEDEQNSDDKGGVIIDSTMEYCRNLGEIPTYGLAGNRKDAIDVSTLEEEKPVVKESDSEDDDTEVVKKRHREEKKHGIVNEYELAIKEAKEVGKGKWFEATATTSAETERGLRDGHRSDDEDILENYNVLGEERDVTKGVAAMLKLAAEKGYLESREKRKVKGPSLKHLESKRFSQIETSRYDIEEKYTKKLERMGTTGTGPVRPFPEKTDYKPDIQITYIDERGREMESKDAFRVLSWKFHGKGPGKKQVEKRQAKLLKKELMKKMNSSDTPLGTLDKQLKKQEVLQTPYIILSGSGRDTGFV